MAKTKKVGSGKHTRDVIKIFRNFRKDWIMTPVELVEKIRPSLKNPNSIDTDGSYIYIYTYDHEVVVL